MRGQSWVSSPWAGDCPPSERPGHPGRLVGRIAHLSQLRPPSRTLREVAENREQHLTTGKIREVEGCREAANAQVFRERVLQGGALLVPRPDYAGFSTRTIPLGPSSIGL